MQQPRRRQKGAKDHGGRGSGACCGSTCSRSATRTGRGTRSTRNPGYGCNQNLQGRHHDHGHRKRCLQRPWRRLKGIAEQIRLGLDCGTRDNGRQHRCDRSDRQVQGWDLLEVAAPFGHVFEPRRSRRVADRSVILRRQVSAGGRKLVAQQRL
jgi:hypothetical protein